MSERTRGNNFPPLTGYKPEFLSVYRLFYIELTEPVRFVATMNYDTGLG